MNFPIVLNFIGGPGAGKSQGATYCFSKLKMAGINCEYVSEYAKDKTWEKNNKALDNQAYVFGKQYFKMTRCQDDVDIIVTDSPLINSIFYNKDKLLGKDFDDLVLKIFNSYTNIVYYVNRVKEYNPKGRSQSKEEADQIGKLILYSDTVKKLNCDINLIDGKEEDYDKVIEKVIELYNKMKNEE